MPTAFEAIDGWIDEARTKLENGGIQKGDLDQLSPNYQCKPAVHTTTIALSPCSNTGHPLSSHWDGVTRTGAGFGDGDCDRGTGVALQYGARRGSGRLAGHPLPGSTDRI